MPNKAKSKAQFRMFEARKSGNLPADVAPGLTPDKAGEMLGKQSPKGLPEKAPKTVDEYDRTGKFAKKGKPGFGK